MRVLSIPFHAGKGHMAHYPGVVGGGAPCRVPRGGRIFLNTKTKEESNGFPTEVKRFTNDKWFWRKFELKINFFQENTC